MRKQFLVLMAACLFSVSLSAQSFGLRVGVNATNASIDVDDADVDVDGETNLMLGLFFNLPLGTDVISLQPEVNYLNRGYTRSFSVGNLIDETYSLAYLDLGALVRVNLGSDDGLGFYLGAGPQFSYAVSGSYTTINEDRDVDFDADRINRGELQFSGVVGLTYQLGVKFFLEGRYNGSFSNQRDLDTEDIRQRSVGVNGGIMIPLGG